MTCCASRCNSRRAVNHELEQVVKGESFATAIAGVVDAETRTLRICSAGGPPLLVVHADGVCEEIESAGVPLGVMEGAPYEEVEIRLAAGDCLLLFSDGAVEIHDAEGDLLGVEGLMRILKELGYPQSALSTRDLDEALLRYSNAIRLMDDVTLIEVRFGR